MRRMVSTWLAAAVLLRGVAVAPLGAQEAVDHPADGLRAHHPQAAALVAELDAAEVNLLTGIAEARQIAVPERALEVLRYGQDFRREVLDLLADRGVADPGAAIESATDRYIARIGVALPAQPKTMDVLYDHPWALAFRSGHPDRSGALWSAHWFRLALTEPLADLADAGLRAAGVDTVAARYRAKLTPGDPPAAFPSELPLAPAIAPGLIQASPGAAMVWDNLSMFTEVVADILTEASPPDAPAAIETAVDHFVTPGLAVTGQVMWETMALRHGIFFQGGFPLAVMTESERNADSHAMHLRSGRGAVIPGMMRR